jgi:ABC-type dipeptide/oligopeptide/nickel transport system ATPase component
MTEETENKIAIEISEQSDAQKMSEKLLENIMQSLTENGKLLIIGLGGTGKTTVAMHIVRFIMNSQKYKDGKVILRIGDSANVWKQKFDRIPYVDVTKKPSIPEDEKIVLLDLGFVSTTMNVSLIENLVGQDYYIQRESMNENNGQPKLSRIYVLEEIQNLFGSYKRSEFWLKIWSESRNYGQFFIGIGQRLSDISTRIVERTKYMLIGSISGDNDRQKLKRMFGTEKGERVVNALMGLRKGEFLWIDKENTEQSMKIYFPAFVQSGKPYEFDSKGNGHIHAERVFL